MNCKELNFVFLSTVPFPNGYAMTKRWRYMIDTLMQRGATCHYLLANKMIETHLHNEPSGVYGAGCDYIDITHTGKSKGLRAMYRLGREQLRRWYDPKRRNVVLSNRLELAPFPLCRQAHRMGYEILLDIVETSYLTSPEHLRLASKVYRNLSDFCLRYTLRHYCRGGYAISTRLKEEMLDVEPRLKVQVLPNSTPLLAESRMASLHKPLRVLYSGTFGGKDGVRDLIDGVIQAYGRGCDCRLTLLGKGMKHDMQVLEGTERYPFIHYGGYVSEADLVRTMLDSDVLCMTRVNSKFANYGFPFKLSEYLATGRVVLATRVSDVAHYLTDRRDAYLVEPDSPQAIADALLYISQHEQESLDIATRGLETMQREFGMDVVTDKLLALLQELN